MAATDRYHMADTIIIGSDHGGFFLKEFIKKELDKEQVAFEDVGCFSDQSVNYPEFGAKVAERISRDDSLRGILLCGTGIGMSLVANRYKNVRATLCHDHLTARLSREHNNSNILVLGGRLLGEELAADILHTWLHTPFQAGRHKQRIDMIERCC